VNNIEHFSKALLFKLLGIFTRGGQIEGPALLDEIKNILIVRQHNQLGDMLCAVPLIRALRQRFPLAFISLVASPVNYPVVLRNPYLDEVINYDKITFFKTIFGFWRLCKILRSRRYELAIVPATVSVSVTSDVIAYLSRARIRIGARSLDGKKNITGFLFNAGVDLDWRAHPLRHQINRNLDIVRPFGITTTDLRVVIEPTDEEKEFADKFIELNIGEKVTAVGLHPGAGKEMNRWSPDKFAELADRLAGKFSALVVVSQGPIDEEPVKAMTSRLKCGYTVLKAESIRAEAAVIDKLSLFITNDTGMMHVAGATRTPVLSLFGPTDPLQWAPLGCWNKFIVGEHGNIDSIPVEKVYRIAVGMIRSYRDTLDYSEQ
jgi:heptosyltransferase-2